ncbi:PA2778 family cysteine peptidase [Methylophaga thalassica]|uniref:PA2778 family cysteine peptidase n=1 Tax=Methylophaga thalassica TaxID=40223 RepID=UPI002E7AB8FB|nr:PA2778 family cysteine peptidase [Methylophaga thalassica]WVI85222.1 PA2778 family cysteine peptidase [Methylophaga thalassica]
MILITKQSFFSEFKNARLSGVFFILLFLSACASAPQTKDLLNSPPANIPLQHELTETAFFPQEEYQCGPAALATILTSEGIDVVPQDLTAKVYLPEKKGSLQVEMIATARSYQLMPYKLNSDIKAIIEEVNSGRPVLVFQNLGLTWYPVWHYAVVIGYELDNQLLILRSGTEKRHQVSFQTFEHTWQRGRYWAYVFVQPNEVPVTANLLSYTRAADALMQVGQDKNALLAHKTATQQWPDQTLSHMALGNAEFKAGHYKEAGLAFENAIRVAPENAQAWNNLSYALMKNNCRFAATRAIVCATRIAPDDDNLKDSLQEIIGQRSVPGGQCEIPTCPEF